MIAIRNYSHNDMNQALFVKVEQGLMFVYVYGITGNRIMV